MNDYDSRVGLQLHQLAEQEPISQPPTALLLERGRRARRRRVQLSIGTSCAAVVVAAAAIFAIQGTGAATAPPGTVANDAVQPARLRLVAAVAATGKTSFSMRIALTAEATEPGAVLTTEAQRMLDSLKAAPRRAEGALDPTTNTGYLRTAQPGGGHVEQRLLNGELFIGDGTVWKQHPGQHPGLSFSALGGEQLAVTADPARLLDSLRDLGEVTQLDSPGTGAATVDIYRFTAVKTVPVQASPGAQPASGQPVTLSGEVSVDRAGQKIIKVAYRVPFAESGSELPLTAVVTLELSDYGTAVEVERPGNVIP